jgi:hypothetical protein
VLELPDIMVVLDNSPVVTRMQKQGKIKHYFLQLILAAQM